MTDTQITIRPGTPEDAELVAKFNAAMALETENKALSPHLLQQGCLAGLSDPARSLYFLAEVDGKTVGQTMVTLEWSDWRNAHFWWIQSVYVEPGSRRLGVFRALYDHIRRLAQERRDVCGIRLYAHHDNDRAIATYEKLGMTRTEYVVLEEDWST